MLGATITSRTNARVKALRGAFEGKASRPGELVGLEGEHLIAEALRSGFTLEDVFVREGSENVLDRPALSDVLRGNVTVLSAEVFASAVATASPQGIAATLAIPDLGAWVSGGASGGVSGVTSGGASGGTLGVTLILEDLQDPGNVGTLLRSMEAFGGVRVLATRATVNAWNPKVVRSSAGSVFRVPFERMTMAEIRQRVAAMGERVFAAVADGEDSQSITETVFGAGAVLMIGNEGAGLSSEALSMADERVWIPCAVESLNAAVAGSVMLFEALRQREALRQVEELRQREALRQSESLRQVEELPQSGALPERSAR